MANSLTVERRISNIGKGRIKYIEVIKLSFVTAGDGSFDQTLANIEIRGFVHKVMYYSGTVMTSGADITIAEVADSSGFIQANTRDPLVSGLINIPGSTGQHHFVPLLDQAGVYSGGGAQKVLCDGFYQLRITSNSVADVAGIVYIYVGDEA